MGRPGVLAVSGTPENTRARSRAHRGYDRGGHGEGMARAWRGMAKPDHVGLRRVRAALTIIAAPRSRIGAKTPRQAAAPRGHPNDRGRIGWIVANLGVGVVRKRCFPLRPVSPVPPLLP